MEEVIKQYGELVVETIATVVVVGIMMSTVMDVGPLWNLITYVVMTSC